MAAETTNKLINTGIRGLKDTNSTLLPFGPFPSGAPLRRSAGRISGGRVGGYAIHQPPQTDTLWYGGISMIGVSSSVSFTVDTLGAYPFSVAQDVTLDRIAFEVQNTAAHAGAKARVGIYEATSGTNIYPKDLIVDSGEVDVSANGSLLNIITISASLSGGKVYWFAWLTGTAAPELRAWTRSPSCGSLSTNLSNTNRISVAQAYGALPNPFTAGATPNQSTQVAAIVVRLSA